MTEPADLVEQVLVLKDVDLVVDVLYNASEQAHRARRRLATMPGFDFHAGFLAGLQEQLSDLLTAWEEEYNTLNDAFSKGAS